MKLKHSLLTVGLAAGLACGAFLSQPAHAATEEVSPSVRVGIVDFRRCLEESLFGKQEQSSLEALRKQLSGTVEGTERELQDIVRKLRDPDHLDSLSAEAEQQLKVRFQTLSQEMQQQQQQFYQIVNQAEYKLLNELGSRVTAASQAAARDESVDLVLREDAAFYFPKVMDLTDAVLAAMDAAFEAESQGQS